MSLDPPTLIAVVVAGAAASAAVLWTTSRREGSDASTRTWALGFFLVAGYFALVLLASRLPPVIGIGAANGLAVGLMGVMHRGACQLCRQRFRPWVHVAAAAIVTAVIVLFFQDAASGYDRRVQIVGLVTALQCAVVAATLCRRDAETGNQEHLGRRVAAAAFAGLGALQVLRVLAHSEVLGVHEPSILAQTALSASAAAGFLIWSLTVPVVVFYVQEARARQALGTTLGTLQEALDDVRVLRELLPVCASCRRIRDEADRWSDLETYLITRAGVRMTHGLCPECLPRLYPELVDTPGPR